MDCFTWHRMWHVEYISQSIIQTWEKKNEASWNRTPNRYKQLVDKPLKFQINWFFFQIKKPETNKNPNSSGTPHPRLFGRGSWLSSPCIPYWLLTSAQSELLWPFHALICHKYQSSTPPFPVVQRRDNVGSISSSRRYQCQKLWPPGSQLFRVAIPCPSPLQWSGSPGSLFQNGWHVFTLDKAFRHQEWKRCFCSQRELSQGWWDCCGQPHSGSIEPLLFTPATPGPSLLYRMAVWALPRGLLQMSNLGLLGYDSCMIRMPVKLGSNGLEFTYRNIIL